MDQPSLDDDDDQADDGEHGRRGARRRIPGGPCPKSAKVASKALKDSRVRNATPISWDDAVGGGQGRQRVAPRRRSAASRAPRLGWWVSGSRRAATTALTAARAAARKNGTRGPHEGGQGAERRAGDEADAEGRPEQAEQAGPLLGGGHVAHRRLGHRHAGSRDAVDDPAT